MIFGRASKTEPIVKVGGGVSTDSVVAEGSSSSSEERGASRMSKSIFSGGLIRKLKRYLLEVTLKVKI